jgi:ankyrin repeat protein
MSRKDATPARNNVISVRLDDTSIAVIDLLVQSGLSTSRSEAAAQLIALGIQSAEDLILQARQLADNLQRIKREMMDAVTSRDLARVQELLDADQPLVATPTDQGDSPVLMSVYIGAKDITTLLLSRGVELNMYEAAATGNTARVREVLEADKSVIDALSHDGWTALHLAAFFGHLETAAYLVESGADHRVFSQNEMGNQPLHAATAGRRTDVVRLLIESGAELNTPSVSGWTPLHLAAQNGDLDIVEMLLARNVELNAKNNLDKTPLAYALGEGHQAVADLLKSKGAQA